MNSMSFFFFKVVRDSIPYIKTEEDKSSFFPVIARISRATKVLVNPQWVHLDEQQSKSGSANMTNNIESLKCLRNS